MGLSLLLRDGVVGVGQSDINGYLDDLAENDRISFPSLLRVMAREKRKVHSEDALIRAFRAFDPSGSGFVPVADVRAMLTGACPVSAKESVLS